MQQYLDLMERVWNDGEVRPDRTGVGTHSLFGEQLRFDLREGFPLLTTKRVHTRSVIHELLWFLSGDTTDEYLREHGVTIWSEWSSAEKCGVFGRPEGDLGPVYGWQWRHFDGGHYVPTKRGQGYDQIAMLIARIKQDPFSRRHIVTAWNPQDADQVTLPPCHAFVQFYVSTEGRLSCHMYQRSADLFLGVPFNIASYALLTHMIAQVCNLGVADLVISFGDVHLYQNHAEQVALQLTRSPGDLPRLALDPAITDIDDFTYDSVQIVGYNPDVSISAPVAV